MKELKDKIEALKGTDYPAAGQKLIYAGKILSDDSPMSEYSIDEGKFIVVMVSKPKVAAPPPPVAAAPAPVAPTPTSPAPTESTDTPAAATTDTKSDATAAPTATPAADAAR